MGIYKNREREHRFSSDITHRERKTRKKTDDDSLHVRLRHQLHIRLIVFDEVIAAE